jgi:hypothetical protein
MTQERNIEVTDANVHNLQTQKQKSRMSKLMIKTALLDIYIYIYILRLHNVRLQKYAY